MEGHTEKQLRTARDWFAKKADTAQAKIWLFAFSFTEASIFFIPPDPLLVAMVFVHQDRWLKYAVITSIASIIGAVFGYVVGAILFETVGVRLIEIYNLQESMARAVTLIDKNVFVFTLTAAFTPIPFKVAVFGAGFTKANFIAFFVATFVGRSARYILVAYIAKIFGDNAENIMRRFWWYATGVGTAIIVLYALYTYLQ